MYLPFTDVICVGKNVKDVMSLAFPPYYLADSADCGWISSVGGATVTFSFSCMASIDKMSGVLRLTH